MVGDHQGDLGVELAGLPAPEEVEQAVGVLRDEDGHATGSIGVADPPVHPVLAGQRAEGGVELVAAQAEALALDLHPHEEPAARRVADVLVGVDDVPIMQRDEIGDRRDHAPMVGAVDQQPDVVAHGQARASVTRWASRGQVTPPDSARLRKPASPDGTTRSPSSARRAAGLCASPPIFADFLFASPQRAGQTRACRAAGGRRGPSCAASHAMGPGHADGRWLVEAVAPPRHVRPRRMGHSPTGTCSPDGPRISSPSPPAWWTIAAATPTPATPAAVGGPPIMTKDISSPSWVWPGAGWTSPRATRPIPTSRRTRSPTRPGRRRRSTSSAGDGTPRSASDGTH